MKYSLTQAAAASGRSRASLHRDIQAGRISASRDDRGRWWIDAAELHRAFGAKSSQPETPMDGPGLDALRVELEMTRRMLEMEREARKDLARRLDESDQERRRVLALLEYLGGKPAIQQPEPEPAKPMTKVEEWIRRFGR